MISPKTEAYEKNTKPDLLSLQSTSRNWKVKEEFMIETLIHRQQQRFHINKWDIGYNFILMFYIIGSAPVKFTWALRPSLVGHFIIVGIIILAYECFNRAEMQRRRQFNLPPIAHLFDRELYKRISIKERLFGLLIGFINALYLNALLSYAEFVVIVHLGYGLRVDFLLPYYMNLIIPWILILLPYFIIRQKIIKKHWERWWLQHQEIAIHKKDNTIRI